jgi:hypothetical protein
MAEVNYLHTLPSIAMTVINQAIYDEVNGGEQDLDIQNLVGKWLFGRYRRRQKITCLRLYLIKINHLPGFWLYFLT